MWLYYDIDFKFNQIKCKEYGLTTDDLYVLSYLNQLYNSGRAKYITHMGQQWALITFRKLEEDCILTYWKAKTFKNKFKHYQYLGLLEIYRQNPKTPKTYYILHLERLYDTEDALKWTTCSGVDDTLAWYSGIQKIDRFRNQIKYKNQSYKYFSTGIIASVIHKYNKSEKRAYPDSVNSYKEIFVSAFKRLISREVYEKYFQQLNIFFEHGDVIKINFYNGGVREALLCEYRYQIERALCDAFLYICRDVDAREKLSAFDSNLY